MSLHETPGHGLGDDIGAAFTEIGLRGGIVGPDDAPLFVKGNGGVGDIGACVPELPRIRGGEDQLHGFVVDAGDQPAQAQLGLVRVEIAGVAAGNAVVGVVHADQVGIVETVGAVQEVGDVGRGSDGCV